jgi:FkbM family methyltransferase
MSQNKLGVKCINNGKYNVFTIVDDEYIGPTINAGHEWDGWMREDVQKYYIPGTEIFDIGANIGYNSLMFSDYGPVYAFEPVYHKIVDLNIENNKLKHQIYSIPIALSNNSDSVYMYLPNEVKTTGLRNYGGTSIHIDEGTDQSSKTVVTCRRLDDVYYDKGKVSFIKLDVEGHEPQVLEGAKKVITKNLPTILVELIDYKNSVVPQILKGFGYTEKPIERPEKMYLFRSPLHYNTLDVVG